MSQGRVGGIQKWAVVQAGAWPRARCAAIAFGVCMQRVEMWFLCIGLWTQHAGVKATLFYNAGDVMTKKQEGKCGFGPFKDEPCRFITIEQKISGIRKWYDKVRQVWLDWSTSCVWSTVCSE